MYSPKHISVEQSSPSISFNSTENKGLLWKLLSENGLFNGIDSNRFADVKQNFESTIAEIFSTTHSNPQITIKSQNQLFVDRMIVILKSFKDERIYTAQDIKEKRKTDFERDLEEKQRNFDLLMKNSKPDNIDFSDKARRNALQIEEKIENIDALLEEQQREREKDLFQKNNNEITTNIANLSEDTTNISDLKTSTATILPPFEQIHASNINTEINSNLLGQILTIMNTILKNQEEIKELIRIRKKKKTKTTNEE